MKRFVALLLLIGAAWSAVDAQPAPYRRWRTLETVHFTVHAPAGLEREGRAAATAAERAYELLSGELVPPRTRISLVVSDDADYSNGYASVVPSNRIVIFATPPLQNSSLRLNEDWLALLITHELTHIFHLDRTRGVWDAAQRVFGRAPFLFPNAYGPSWLTEGLAVYEESRHTAGGRLRDAEHAMLARASALEGRFPRIDELSVATSRFPRGEIAYAYGSLFVDELARAHGDSSVRRFVDAQSAFPIPYWLDPSAEEAFGVSFTRAYERWRDSMQAAAESRRDPLPGWRELTAHGYFATDPRWVNDSTIVYVGGDGTETNAAWLVTTSGVRTRVSRRTSSEANVPLRDGGFLYAQLDYTGPAELRSDLYREKDGYVTRLTHGQRLIQPDVAPNGDIIAVQLRPTRASLVVLDPTARRSRVLREAGDDETWSEPRWSPDGTRIAAAHRAHGGAYTVEVVDVASGGSFAVDRSGDILAAPSWTRDGLQLLYVSEESGTPQLVLLRARPLADSTSERLESNAQTGFSSAELSPDGRLIAAVSLRADGYHIGIAPFDSLALETAGDVTRSTRSSRRTTNTRSTTSALVNSSALSASPRETAEQRAVPFRSYSPWSSLTPRYWYPVIEAAPARGTLLGATTSGSDDVGRHAYSAFLAIPTTGSYPVASLSYRYAGFRQPLIDASAWQDFVAQRSLLNGGTTETVGTLLKRTQDASLAATYRRPRSRSSASVSAGAGVERRSFFTDPGEFLPQLDTIYDRRYTFPRLFLGATWSNLQRPALSISPEDGVSLAVTARQRWRTDLAKSTRSLSVVGAGTAFKSLDLPGFAHHVLALRTAIGVADKRAATALEVGGTSESTIGLLPGYTVGEGRRTFGVRGFPAASTYGTRALAASLEYRAPFILASRGLGLLPLFLDRTSLTAFGDYGIAECVSDPLYVSTCAPSPIIGRPIASVGVELSLGAGVLSWDLLQTVRLGVAVPVVGRERTGAKLVTPYLAIGFSF
ncbi:MAG: hypothetical protein ABI601_12260 [bacterium]